MQPTKFFQHTSSKVMYHLTSSTSSYRDLNNKLHCWELSIYIDQRNVIVHKMYTYFEFQLQMKLTH